MARHWIVASQRPEVAHIVYSIHLRARKLTRYSELTQQHCFKDWHFDWQFDEKNQRQTKLGIALNPEFESCYSEVSKRI